MDFVKRPVAVLTLSFFISFCIAASFAFFQSNIILWAFGALFCLVCPFSVFLKRKKSPRSKHISVALGYVSLVFAGVFASLAFYHSVFPLSEVSKYSGKTAYLEFTVTGVSYESKSSGSYVAKVSRANGARESFTFLIDANKKLSVGGEVKAVVELYEPGAKGDLNEKNYCLSLGAALKGSSDNLIVTEKESHGLKVRLWQLNEKISNTVTSRMSESSGSIVKAVFLGNKRELSAETKRNFANLGISHIVAISGMHVSFLCSAFGEFSKRFRLGKKSAAVLSIFLVLFYMALTGFSASAVRASVICCISSLIMLLGISYDGATALGICGAGMIIVDPFFAFDAGLLLSFSAYAGCLAAGSLKDKIFKKRDIDRKNILRRFSRYIASSFIFTVVIVLFTLPVTWLYYDTTSILAPLSNLIFIPLFKIIMYLCVFLVLAYPITPLFAALSLVSDKFISLVLFTTEKLSSVRNITVSLSYDFAPFIIIAAAVCCIAMCTVRKRKAVVAFAFALVLCVSAYGAGIYAHGAELRDKVAVSRIGYEKGDSVVVLSGGKSVLIDVSDGRTSHVSAVKEEMSRLCITELDVLVVTHYTERHAEYVERLSRSVLVRKAYLAEAASVEESEIRDEIAAGLTESNVKVASLPETLKAGDSEISFAENKYIRGEREPVVSFKIQGKTEDLLYLGSAWNNFADDPFLREIDKNTTAIFGAYGPEMKSAIDPSLADKLYKIYMFSDDYDSISRFIYALDEDSLLGASDRVCITLN